MNFLWDAWGTFRWEFFRWGFLGLVWIWILLCWCLSLLCKGVSMKTLIKLCCLSPPEYTWMSLSQLILMIYLYHCWVGYGDIDPICFDIETHQPFRISRSHWISSVCPRQFNLFTRCLPKIKFFGIAEWSSDFRIQSRFHRKV